MLIVGLIKVFLKRLLLCHLLKQCKFPHPEILYNIFLILLHNLYFQKLDVEPKDVYTIDITDLKSAPKLTELSLNSAYSRYRDNTRIKYDTLKGLKKLKS
eukprot:jgi/Orpsp1_1/1175501/evm.model.c7180000054105.2